MLRFHHFLSDEKFSVIFLNSFSYLQFKRTDVQKNLVCALLDTIIGTEKLVRHSENPDTIIGTEKLVRYSENPGEKKE